MRDVFTPRRIALIAVLLGVLALLYDFARIKPTSEEAQLFVVIEQIEDAQPIKSRAQFTMLPCPKEYFPGAYFCSADDVSVKSLKIDEIEFSSQESGSIIQLNGVGPGCIRRELIEAEFPEGKVANSCFHSYCAGYSVQRPWGRLYFRLPDSSSEQQCIRNVVFNTERR